MEFHGSPCSFCIRNFVLYRGRYIHRGEIWEEIQRQRVKGKETQGRYTWKETEGKRHRERDAGKKTPGKRHRKRDTERN
jgi:hypothetical protein